MKHRILPLALSLAMLPLSSLTGSTLIFSDNFNAPDNASLDASDLAGRRYGILGQDVTIRSARFQHNIASQRLNLLRFVGAAGGDGRIRFQLGASLPTNVWADFAAGTAGTTLLAENGMRVEFDWHSTSNTNGDWISFSAGIDGDTVAEPAMRLNAAGTDYGMLFRPNGQTTQWFDNGVAQLGNPFGVEPLKPRHVIIELGFSSFADSTPVIANAWVDDEQVVTNANFTWAGNAGTLRLELGSYFTGSSIDNLYISGLGGIHQRLSSPTFLEFQSNIANNGSIGTFTAKVDGFLDTATYQLVAGEGDTDNGKFKITGNQLQSNGFNFTTLPHGTALSVRVRATSQDATKTSEWVYFPQVVSDSDGDLLPDDWELSWGTDASWNLTQLKGNGTGTGPGAGTGDFDGDGLTDLQELNYAYSSYPALGQYPGLSPLLADTDGDGLSDKEELMPTGVRPVTNPTVADSDRDGLSDQVESNSQAFTGPTDSGTNPNQYDTDADGFPDGYEVLRGSSPLDGNELPELPSPLNIHALTSDEESGVDPANTYTHAFSGGYAALINGVAFEALTVGSAPVNLTWNVKTSTGADATKNEISALNLNGWDAAAGNVTGTGLQDMMGGFVYSGNGDAPGAYQTYTLTGLTPGTSYEFNLYARRWDPAASGRPSSVTFTNGAETVNAYVLQDRPGIMLENGNPNSAFRLAFPYTAQTDTLVVETRVPLTTIPISGSWHLYGLSNAAAAAAAPAGFAITNLAVTQSPATVTLTFGSEPGAVYAVDYSTAMAPTGQPGGWTQLTGNLPSGGTQTVYQDTTAAGTSSRLFYRVRRVAIAP